MIDLLILQSKTEPPFYSLSIAYGSAHGVIRLIEKDIVSQIIAMVSTHQAKPKAEWLKIGTFGSCPATLYLNKEKISIIIDGEDCGDGSAQSFGLHLPVSSTSEFLKLLMAESLKHQSTANS